VTDDFAEPGPTNHVADLRPGTVVGRIAAAGTTFHYRASGTGPLALLLHGFGMDSRMWEPVVARLGARRRCVAVDLRGAGRTAPGPEASVPLERHADDVAALIAAFGAEAADVVGFSMGGFVLLAALERHPAVVRTAAFVGTRANADDAATMAARAALVRTLLERGRAAAYLELLPKLVVADAADHVLARLRTMLEEQPYEGLIAAQRAMADRPDRMDVLRTTRLPVLVVAGEHDAFAPLPLPTAMADAAFDAQLEVIAGVGHTTPLESPDHVARLLAGFWDRTASASW
jgi:pimeloyl-ACP methyl ester carboxylesterase